MGLWRASLTAGFVARKALEVYFFLPRARPVPVKVGLQLNRYAVGKTANSLVYPRRQQLTPLPCGGPARLDSSLEPRRSAVLNYRLGHRAPGRGGRQARTVSGCVNSAFLNISQHFTGHLFSPWRPSSARGIDGGPRRSTEVVLNEQCSKQAESGGRSLCAAVGSPRQTPGGFSEQPNLRS